MDLIRDFLHALCAIHLHSSRQAVRRTNDTRAGYTSACTPKCHFQSSCGRQSHWAYATACHLDCDILPEPARCLQTEPWHYSTPHCGQSIAPCSQTLTAATVMKAALKRTAQAAHSQGPCSNTAALYMLPNASPCNLAGDAALICQPHSGTLNSPTGCLQDPPQSYALPLSPHMLPGKP